MPGYYETAQALFGARDFSISADVDNTAIPGTLLLVGSAQLERRITDFTIHNADGAAAADIIFYDQNSNRKYTARLAADETAVISLRSAIVWQRNEDIYARTSSAVAVAEISISGKESEPWA